MKVLSRIGGMIVAPRATLAGILADERAGTGAMLGLIAAACVVALPIAVLQEALLARVGLWSGVGALAELVARYALLPVGVLAALWAITLGWLVAKGRKLDGRRAAGLAVGAAWLYVPWFVTVLAGRGLAAAGVRGAWLPHGPVTALDGISVARLVIGAAWSAGLVPVLVAVAAWEPGTAPSPAGRGAPAIVAGAAVLLLGVGGVALAAREMAAAYPQIRPVMKGDVAPELALPFLDAPATRRKLSALRGKVVVVDFWATWCPPCVESLPALDRLYDTHRAAGLEVVAVNRDGGGERIERVRSFLASHALKFPVALDDGSAALAYRVARLPTTYLLDRAGVVRDTWVGIADAEDLDRRVRELLVAP